MAGVGNPSAGRAAGRGTARGRRRRGAGRACGCAGLARWRTGAQGTLIKDKESQIILAFQLFMAYTGIG